MARAWIGRPHPWHPRAHFPPATRFFFPALLTILQALSTVGCRTQTRSRDRSDLCRRLVDRSIRCLELELKAGETDGFSDKERLERERIHRRDATEKCRVSLHENQNLAKELAACLELRNCMAYRDCREAAALRARAAKALAVLSKSRRRNGTDARDDPSWICRDRYLEETLGAQGDATSKALLAKLHRACKSLEQRRITDIAERIARALDPSNEHPLSDLSQTCTQVSQGGPDKEPHEAVADKQHRSAQRKAIENLCREQWRLRSALSNIRRLRGFLKPPGCAECALRVCRFLTVTKGLKRSPLPAVQSLVRRFERLCRVTAPVFWIENRLTRRRRPGPMTCRRARSLLNRAVSRDPDDPTVQVAACLLDLRCRSRRSNH